MSYQYSFARELLHKTLLERPVHAVSRNIFGVERSDFAWGYMSTILTVRMQSSQDTESKRLISMHLGHFLNTAEYRSKSIYYAALIQSANRLKEKEENQQSETEKPKPHTRSFPSLESLRVAEEAFLAILKELRSSDPETAKAEQTADKQHGQIVNLVLRPVIQRIVGRQTLKNYEE